MTLNGAGKDMGLIPTNIKGAIMANQRTEWRIRQLEKE
jgi:hypothetical protein